MNTKKRILVTGGAGFLGSHLCERLLQEGHKVICIDNLFTGCLNNLESFINHSSFTFMEKDICEPFDLKVDYICNFACPASPPHYQKDPVKTVKTNVLGALSMLDLAQRQKATIIQASTSEVYGDPHMHPQQEKYWGHVNPIGLRSCYDEGKRCAETLCFDYHRQYRLSIKVVRIFNTFGPRMHPNDGRVISNFIVQALQNFPITLYGDGMQTRSFCYVDDLIDAIISMMKTQACQTGPINLGNPLEYTIREMAELIIKLTGSQSKITYHPLPQDDPKQRCPDIDLAKSLLNWQPKICLEEGLCKTIQYFDQVLLNNKIPFLY
ncbi:MAG: NAD-dependent dehydratase [Chlamydiae bacterium]|nr:MAG: NAD-dependent dehydratase [Chlamydiota bacterium]